MLPPAMSLSKMVAMAAIVSGSKTLSISPLLRSHLSFLSSLLPPLSPAAPLLSQRQMFLGGVRRTQMGQQFVRFTHDGRPRGPLWRGKKMIGKEAVFVILGLKRFKEDDEKLEKFVKNHVLRLLKMDMVAVLNELERQQEVSLAVKVFD